MFLAFVLFHTGTETAGSCFTTPNHIGTATSGWKFLLFMGVISNSLPQPDLGDHHGGLSKPPPTTSVEAVCLCKSPGCKKNSLFCLEVGGVGKEGPSKKYIVEDVLTGSHSGHCVGRQFHGSFVNLPCFPKHRARLYRAPSPPSVSTA